MGIFSRNSSHCWKCRHEKENFQTVWANSFLVLTRPSLLQTLIFWHFVYYQSISPIFKENIKHVSCVKIPNFTVSRVSSILHVQFRSKIDSRKLSPSLIGSFLTEITFLNQMSNFSRNSNHRWKCRDQKEDFQTILFIIFWNFTMF